MPRKQIPRIEGVAKLTGLTVIILSILGIGNYINIFYNHFKPSLTTNIIWGIVAFCTVILLTPLVIILAKRLNIVDRNKTPTTPIQKQNIPLLGGIAIYCGLIITFFLYCKITHNVLPLPLQSILFACSLIFVVGIIDDIKPLSSIFRLIAQIVAAIIVMSSGVLLSFTGSTILGDALSVFLTLIWILGIVNAINFFDGADGLATGMSVIAAIFFFLITIHQTQPEVSLLCAIIVGAGTGFLFFNFCPAKIYLGDSGSTLLGFLIATVALWGSWSEQGPIVALSIPVIILGVLIFDMIYITISRILNGNVKNFKEWLDHRGRDHFHHRLMNMKFLERHAVGFIFLVCLILGINALELESSKTFFAITSNLVQSTLIFIMIAVLMLVGRKIS